MTQDLFSVEQIATLLGLHVRTVRNYVRAGRLKAVRIGKQYRIAREALEAFTGQPLPPSDAVPRLRHVEVSSVVQVDAISGEAAGRISTTLMAAARSGSGEGPPLRVDTIYDAERGRLKLIVTGGLTESAGLLRMIAALTESGA
jgi:excisionase family DNA binding protein